MVRKRTLQHRRTGDLASVVGSPIEHSLNEGSFHSMPKNSCHSDHREESLMPHKISDRTTSHSTKPLKNSGQVAGYPCGRNDKVHYIPECAVCRYLWKHQ